MTTAVDGSRLQWSREDVLQAVEEWADQHGRVPLPGDWLVSGGMDYPSAVTARKRFGGDWNVMLEAAGFDAVEHPNRPTVRRQEEVINAYEASGGLSSAAEALGISPGAVRERLHRAGYNYRARRIEANIVKCRRRLEQLEEALERETMP